MQRKWDIYFDGTYCRDGLMDLEVKVPDPEEISQEKFICFYPESVEL